jgi:KDO2-lipid IV(A) lauroyltransferase
MGPTPPDPSSPDDPPPQLPGIRPAERTRIIAWTWWFLAPRYWGTWVQIGLMSALARLPVGVQERLGRLIGRLFLRLGRSRRHIASTNLRLCFPALDDRGHRALLRRTFESMGISLLETATAWFGRPEARLPNLEVVGMEALDAARADGTGVVLLGGHFATLDLAGALLGEVTDLDVMYRPDGNDLMEYFMQRGRARRYGAVIARKDTRAAVRRLRAGHVLWYAADQDYGPHHSVFAPFFGMPAATVTGASRFAKLGRARAAFISHFRGPEPGHYQLRIQALPDFPSGDDEADARRMNAIIEQEIRRDPAQYLWLHRRFKTRPPGEPGVY